MMTNDADQGRRLAALEAAKAERAQLKVEEGKLRRELDRVGQLIATIERTMRDLVQVIYDLPMPAAVSTPVPSYAPGAPSTRAEPARAEASTPSPAALERQGGSTPPHANANQKRRATNVDTIRAALARLGGAANRRQVWAEVRQEDPEFSQGKVGAVLQRSGCFVVGTDGLWHAVDGARILTDSEQKLRDRRELVSQVLRELGGRGRFADILDRLQRIHGARVFDKDTLNRDLRRGGFVRTGRYGGWALPAASDAMVANEKYVHPTTLRKLQAVEAALRELGGSARTKDILQGAIRRLSHPMTVSDLLRVLHKGPFHREGRGVWAFGRAEEGDRDAVAGPLADLGVKRLTVHQQRRRELVEIVSEAIRAAGGAARRDQILDAVRSRLGADYGETRLTGFLVKCPAFRSSRDRKWSLVEFEAGETTPGEKRSLQARRRKWSAIQKAIESTGGAATRRTIWDKVKGNPSDFLNENALAYLLRTGPFENNDQDRWIYVPADLEAE